MKIFLETIPNITINQLKKKLEAHFEQELSSQKKFIKEETNRLIESGDVTLPN